MTTQQELSPILYGVWVPKSGWVRGDQAKALMFEYKFIAEETAKRIRRDAKVYYIDQSLVDIEAELLKAEQAEFFKPWFLFEIKRLYKFFVRS